MMLQTHRQRSEEATGLRDADTRAGGRCDRQLLHCLHRDQWRPSGYWPLMTTLLQTHLCMSLSVECHSKSSIQSISHRFPRASTQSCTPSSLCIQIYTIMSSIYLSSLSTTVSICFSVYCLPYTNREKVMHTGWLIYYKCTQPVVLINNRQDRVELYRKERYSSATYHSKIRQALFNNTIP